MNNKLILGLILILALVLRVWGLDKVPPSLFGDELDVGYQAYSILKTGKDYSGNFLPIHFKSLAEYRTPFFPYTAVPTIAIFGISEWGVRLPVAFFGVLGVLAIYFLVKEITSEEVGWLAGFLLAINPWHLHFSRTGFDGPQMLLLYTLGLYFLLRTFKGKNTLWLSAICFGLTPWAYNTAKLFLPLTTLVILILWGKEIFKFSRKRLITAVAIFALLTIPFFVSTFFGGGTERFQGISIFNDQTTIPQMGFDRQNDVKARGESSVGLIDKLFHNKITVYTEVFAKNYLQSFSTEFLFTKGDNLNPRQSSGEQLYMYQFLFLILGLVFLINSKIDKKVKLFLIFWFIASPIPSALTQGGGSHATRLITMIPILMIMVTLGIYFSFEKLDKKYKIPYLVLIGIFTLLGFIFYQHNYWIHYPFKSERWWHSGFKEAVRSAVSEGKRFDKVIVSGADEPPLIFFLAWSEYPPASFQKNYPLVKEILPNFGEVSRLDNYYFPPIGEGKNLYELGKALPPNTLYLATAKEISLDLVKEPGRIPNDLRLIKSISYPSGDPAFYLLTKNENP